MADETFTCPECGTEMIRSPLDPDFLIHVEPTDCAPNPWPTAEEARIEREVRLEEEMNADLIERDHLRGIRPPDY